MDRPQLGKPNPCYSPCKDCEDRKVGCHCVCDKYLKYKADVDDYYKSIKSDKEYVAYTTDKIAKATKVNFKRNRRRFGK